MKRKRLEKIKKEAHKVFMCHCVVIILMLLYAIICISNQSSKCDTKRQETQETQQEVNESYNKTIKPEKAEISYNDQIIVVESKIEERKELSDDEEYLLAKIAMAEAEGCSTKTKELIILCVLNRVCSDEFPDTIEEVIFQKNQFSPIDNGRWDRVEPNEDCYEAVKAVMEAKYDYSAGATYFESCDDEDNWHSRNLKLLYKSDGIRFYK